MKTLTTLTAIAALIAGISIASAQGTMKPSSSGTIGGGAGMHVTGSGKFCIKGAGGALNCQYASLAACQKVVKSGESCQVKPSSTTGSGSTAK